MKLPVYVAPPGRFHALIANPPYILPPTAKARAAYRTRYVAAHAKYGMGLPFTERMFELLVDGGFVAQITSNAFMKREHGKALVTDVLPHYDLTHVIDAQGCYIPGHGTPTVILAARNQAPVRDDVLMVMGRRGEPTTPRDHVGRVWSSILKGLGAPPFEAPGGPKPIGLTWAGSMEKAAKALRDDVMRHAKLPKEEAASLAAAWFTTAAALHALDLCRPSFGESPSDDAEHLARSFERVARALPFARWFDPDAGVNLCWTHTITDAWSARVRAEVARVVDPATIPREQQGRTDWIGDLYQGLDEAARDLHAFCQTPFFVTALLCDLSVEPALDHFGTGATTLDPACGTGHLLCEAFARVYRRRAASRCGCPWGACSKCARASLDQVHGWELNPVAAAIAEWRLMLAWVDAVRPRRLAMVPDDLPIHVRVCDALLVDRPEGHVDHAKRWVAPASDAGLSPAATPTPTKKRSAAVVATPIEPPPTIVEPAVEVALPAPPLPVAKPPTPARPQLSLW